MQERTEDFLTACSAMDFGAVSLSDGEREFASALNGEIFLLCKSLPKSKQTDAALFLMQYTGTSVGDETGFVRYYYPPTWSILYWLIQSEPNREQMKADDIENAKAAHAMAMLLHPLDDHLNDGQLPPTHLTLLLRSQAWMIMNQRLSRLADGVEDGRGVIEGFIDDYYSGITSQEETESLDSYCDLFRKQMATGLITPVLVTRKMSRAESFTRAVQSAYCSFGIAWRLLDDVKDIEADLRKGNRSAVYVCLPEGMKNGWNEQPGATPEQSSRYRRELVDSLRKHCVIDHLMERICRELEEAASIADDCELTGLAGEFRCLLHPLKTGEGRS